MIFNLPNLRNAFDKIFNEFINDRFFEKNNFSMLNISEIDSAWRLHYLE